jgi:hypothetical protein
MARKPTTLPHVHAYVCVHTLIPWPEPASELYRQSDSRLSAKLVPTFADRGCHVVSVTDPNCRILGFLDRSRYFFFQAASQLYSRGWANSIPNPLLINSGSAGNRTLTTRPQMRYIHIYTCTYIYIYTRVYIICVLKIYYFTQRIFKTVNMIIYKYTLNQGF